MMFEDSDGYAALGNCDNIPTSPSDSLTSQEQVEMEMDGENMNEENFKETFKNLEALARLLVCLKCGNLPNEKIWTLGCCLHKYCETCVKNLTGKSCIACGKTGYPKDVKPDLFSSAILAEIPSVYMTIARLEGMNWQENEDEIESVKNEEKKQEGVGVEEEEDPFEFIDEKEIESTPVNYRGNSVSQNFPEVLEETPQNKVRGRYSITSGTGKNVINPVALTFSSHESDANETIKKEKTLSPEKANNSDEELFRSPRPRHKSNEGGKSPLDGLLPVLTPYQNTSASKLAKGMGNKNNKNKLGGRNSGELDPPKLTPQKKDSSTVENVPVKRALRRRKSSVSSVSSESSTMSAKNRKGKNSKPHQENAETTDNLKETPEQKPRVNKKKPESLPSSDGKRLSLSSSTNGRRDSVNVPTPSSKEKRNAKGETLLHVACRAGQYEKVESLVDNGADVDAKDYAGWTPIHEVINGKGTHAVKSNILRFLCEKKGDVNALGGSDDTPLHCAVQSGVESLVEILLEYRASPNIRNKAGQLPKDLAYNDVIITLLNEKMGNVPISSSVPENVNLDNSSFLGGTTSMVEEDPAVMQVMLKKAVIYFNFKVDCNVIEATKEKLGLKVSEELTSNVTHIVHQLPEKIAGDSFILIPLSKEYLYALAHCMWQVNSLWITKSLESGACLIPTSYEIGGYCRNGEGESEEEDEMVPAVSRMNREKGNPGLLNGFCFYLYKSCGFNGPQLKLNKLQLIELIKGAGGTTIIREPNPDHIDPTVETPNRFHVSNSLRCSEDPLHSDSNKFTLTSHIILYEEGAPPPPNKRYNMEHVKSLKSSWLIDSLLHFRLEDPDKYL